MNPLTIINWASLIIFYGLVIWFFYSRRKKLATQWYIFFAYRTKKGLNFVRKLANKLRGFWKIYGYIGIPLGFILMIVIIGSLIHVVINFLAAPEAAAPAVGLVLPWATTGVHGPIITVSIWYFIIAAGITLLVHEGSHAVISATHKIKLKSSGVGLFAIIPFAFVEPDDEAIKKSDLKKQLSVFAAGPVTNVILSVLVCILIFFVIIPPIASNAQINGLEIMDINESLPAGASALEEGDIITQIDNTSLTNVDALRAGILAPSYKSVLAMPPEKYDCLRTTPNQTITITTKDGESTTITAVTSEQNASVGVVGFNKLAHVIEPRPGETIKVGILGVLYNILAWVAIFNLGIGLFNLLPFSILDGGQMLRASIKRIFKKNRLGLKIFALISLLTLSILLISMLGPWLVGLLK